MSFYGHDWSTDFSSAVEEMILNSKNPIKLDDLSQVVSKSNSSLDDKLKFKENNRMYSYSNEEMLNRVSAYAQTDSNDKYSLSSAKSKEFKKRSKNETSCYSSRHSSKSLNYEMPELKTKVYQIESEMNYDSGYKNDSKSTNLNYGYIYESFNKKSMDLINKEIELFNKGYGEHVEKCSKENAKIEASSELPQVEFKLQKSEREKSLARIEEDTNKAKDEKIELEIGLKRSHKTKSKSQNKSFKEYYRSSRDGTKGYFKSTTLSRFQSERELNQEETWSSPYETNRSSYYGGFSVYMNNFSCSDWKSEPMLLEKCPTQYSVPKFRAKKPEKAKSKEDLSLKYKNPNLPPKPGYLMDQKKPRLEKSKPKPTIKRARVEKPIDKLEEIEKNDGIVIREGSPADSDHFPSEIIEIHMICALPLPKIEPTPPILIPAPAQPDYVEAQLLTLPPQTKSDFFIEKKEAKPQVEYVLSPPEIPKHVIIQWDRPDQEIKQEFKFLGVEQVDPLEYMSKYAKNLTPPDQLPNFVNAFEILPGEKLAEHIENFRPTTPVEFRLEKSASAKKVNFAESASFISPLAGFSSSQSFMNGNTLVYEVNQNEYAELESSLFKAGYRSAELQNSSGLILELPQNQKEMHQVNEATSDTDASLSRASFYYQDFSMTNSQQTAETITVRDNINFEDYLFHPSS